MNEFWREQLENYMSLQQFAFRGIQEHLESDKLDAPAVSAALMLLNKALDNLITEAAATATK